MAEHLQRLSNFPEKGVTKVAPYLSYRRTSSQLVFHCLSGIQMPENNAVL